MAKKGTSTPASGVVEPGVLLNLDPAEILAGENIRFSLKDTRIEMLANSILEQGGVLEPIGVERLETPSNGHKYSVVFGNYRHAAVVKLNEQGAGLTIPALLQTTANPVDRLKRQTAENMERENQSPMDQAVAIRKLMDVGLSRMEIRQIFSRPGGRKGTKVQPASNSYINMTLSFLDLPKAIQTKIHDGEIGVAAAYELTKCSPDKRDAILEKAEAERAKELEKDEREEKKVLEAEAKAAEITAKLQEVESDLVTARTEAESAKAKHELAKQSAIEAYEASRVKGTPEEKKKAAEVFKHAEAVRKAAEYEEDKLTKILTTSEQKHKAAEENAAKHATNLKALREGQTHGAAKPKQAVGPKDVKRAAQASGETTNGHVPLTRPEIIAALSDWGLPGGDTTIIQISRTMLDCFKGVTTPKQAYSALKKIVNT